MRRRTRHGTAPGSAAVVRRAVKDAAQRFADIGTGERRPAREHLVQDAAEGPYVAPLIGGPSHDLLGAHVWRGPGDRRAADRVEAADVNSRRLTRERPRETEVEHLDRAARGDHHVGRLEVAMDHALFVGGAQGVGDLVGDAKRLPHRYRPAPSTRPGPSVGTSSQSFANGTVNPLVQGLPLHELQYERAVPGAFLDAVNRCDVGVVQAGERARLAIEAALPVRNGRHAGRQHLQRHVTAEPGVARAIDLTHPARAEMGHDLIWPDAATDRCRRR